jgi:hypothetical protein
MTDDEETAGLLALMLLHHARRPARTRRDGSLVPLAEQDRSRWDTSLIAEGVTVLQTALGRDRLGEFQAQAAIAALHAGAPRVEETDWVQIVGWYNELLRLTGSPVVQLNRAIAIGEADSPVAGLAALATVDPGLPGCMPTPPGPPPTSPNVTTSPGRQRGSVTRCVREPVPTRRTRHRNGAGRSVFPAESSHKTRSVRICLKSSGVGSITSVMSWLPGLA